MAAVHGSDAVVIGDEIALTGFLNNTTVTSSVQTVNVTAFGNNSEVFLAGVGSGSLALAGMFDAAANASDAELHGALAAASGKIVTVGYGGLAIGNRVSMIQGRITSYNVQSPAADAVRVSATFDGDGPVSSGVSLHDLVAVSGAGNYASVDQSSSSAFGGFGQLHVTALTGTNVIVKIQDSTDNSTFADFITFTSATGATQQRSATVTGTLNRYVRAIVSGGTFSSATFTCSLARNFR